MAQQYPITFSDFHSKEAKKIQRLVDYYEGRQMHHLIHIMNGKGEHGVGKRAEWKTRGIVPRVRNVTQTIVNRSGLLYNRPPKLAIQLPGQDDPVTDDDFMTIMESADWLENFQNIDVYTRLCKSTIVLLQKYIPKSTTTVNGQYRFDNSNGDALLITLLHQGNSVALMNPQRTQITALAYLTSCNVVEGYDDSNDSDDAWYYRLITPEAIVDFKVDYVENKGGGTLATAPAQEMTETVIAQQPNPEGIVPACFFYDVNKPRSGVWVDPPEDLLSLQEVVNLHITDLEFAIAWQKQKTMVITGDLDVNKNNGPSVIPAAQPGYTAGGEGWKDIALYAQQNTDPLAVGGLGSVVKVGVDDRGNPGKVEFVGPTTDLGQLDTIIRNYIEGVANDWDVNIDYGGQGAAQSGFQLIVEETNNLNLREKRSQSAIAGLRRFYEIMKQLYPQLTDGQLTAEFAPPSLPVNIEEQEQIWVQRIADNRASRVDYFMEVKGMTQAQAEAKVEEILTYNTAAIKELAAANPTPVPVPPPPGTTEAGQQNAATNPVRPAGAATAGITNG